MEIVKFSIYTGYVRPFIVGDTEAIFSVLFVIHKYIINGSTWVIVISCCKPHCALDYVLLIRRLFFGCCQ